MTALTDWAEEAAIETLVKLARCGTLEQTRMHAAQQLLHYRETQRVREEREREAKGGVSSALRGSLRGVAPPSAPEPPPSAPYAPIGGAFASDFDEDEEGF